MKSVFLVTHCHELEDDREEIKVIGVYKTKIEAQLAVRRMRKREGFCDYPKGFNIDQIEIGRDQWCEGFFTYRYSSKKRSASLASR